VCQYHAIALGLCTCANAYDSLLFGDSLFSCLVCLSLSSCIAQDWQALRIESHFPLTVGSDLFWSMTAVIPGFDHLCAHHVSPSRRITTSNIRYLQNQS